MSPWDLIRIPVAVSAIVLFAAVIKGRHIVADCAIRWVRGL